MELRFLATAFSLLLIFLPSICTGQNDNAEGSTSLSLRDAIREVAEVTNVLPLDVYAGTTLSEYRNWNCRYDLTYSEFRPNYALYEVARNASVSEALECVEELTDMSAKEKALTCAALIAFVESQREREARGVVPAEELLSDDAKRLVLQKLERELNDRDVAFYHVEDNELSARWENNLREECGYYMSLDRDVKRGRLYDVEWECRLTDDQSWFRDDVTATRSCSDLYLYPRDDGKFPMNKLGRVHWLFASWNNDTKQLPVEFLCALVLAQATYDEELLNTLYFGMKELAGQNRSLENWERVRRKAVVKSFNYCKTSIYDEHDKLLDVWSQREKMFRHAGEYLIMNAYLRTQFIAARSEIEENEEPISGNSHSDDVLVSEVVQKAIDVLSDDSFGVEVISASRTNEERKVVDDRRNCLSLLETIQKYANDSAYFSLPLFIKMFETCEQKLKHRREAVLDLTATYERCRPLCMIYETAKYAAHDEIVECLKAFEQLTVKEKTFVLAVTTLYIIRSESSEELKKKTLNDRELTPLTDDEKKIFSQCVLDCCDNEVVAYEGGWGTKKREKSNSRLTVEELDARDRALEKEWESSFRDLTLSYQKILGKWNPFYEYSSRTEEQWRDFCDETPVHILYSMLAMETRCNLDDLRLASYEDHKFDHALTNGIKEEMAWANEIEDEEVRLEVSLMRDYLFLTSELARREPMKTTTSGYFPDAPNACVFLEDLRLCDVARLILKVFPTMKTDGLPEGDSYRRQLGDPLSTFPY